MGVQSWMCVCCVPRARYVSVSRAGCVGVPRARYVSVSRAGCVGVF